jgi:hypothetical protein
MSRGRRWEMVDRGHRACPPSGDARCWASAGPVCTTVREALRGMTWPSWT